MLSPRICTTFFALLGMACLLLSHAWHAPKALPRTENPSGEEHRILTQLQHYRVGHDWVEPSPPPPEENSAPSKARRLIRDENPVDPVVCQQAGCRTCQWTQLFGGEW